MPNASEQSQFEAFDVQVVARQTSRAGPNAARTLRPAIELLPGPAGGLIIGGDDESFGDAVLFNW